MDINQPDRTQLKAYFIKYAVPSEQQFAELIDGMINQADDRIVKPPGSPLCLESMGDAQSPRQVLHLYRAFEDVGPAWTLSLNPRTVVSDPSTARPGLSIDDSTGLSRLFIDDASGRVGVGTVEPQAKLHIVGDLRADAITTTTLEVLEQPDWITPTFAAGTKEHVPPSGASYDPVGYCKDSLGWVHMRGLIEGTGGDPTNPMFTLPPGYRPLVRKIFLGFDDYTSASAGRIDITANGAVWASSSSWLSLDNVHFRAEQ